MGQITPATGGLCIPTTAEAYEYFGKNTPIGRENDGTALLQFLKSNINMRGLRDLSDDIIGVPGKTRGVKIWHRTPFCFSVCASPFNCLETPTPFTPPISVFEYEIESRYTPCDGAGNPMELYMDSTEYALYCSLEDATEFNNRILDFDTKLVKEFNKTLVNLLFANVTNTPVTYPIITNNTITGQRVINDELLVWLHELVSTAKMNLEDYVIFGGKMVNLLKLKYNKKTMSSEGAEYVVDGLPAMYYERNFDAVFGTNALLLLPIGAFQLVQWKQYVGSKMFKDERTILMNKTVQLGNGATQDIDFVWEYDPKCSKYKYFPSLYAELVKAISGNCVDANQDGIFIVKDCNTSIIPTCA